MKCELVGVVLLHGSIIFSGAFQWFYMCARIIYANSLYVMLTVKFKYWTLFFSTLRFQLPWISNERNPELRTNLDHYSIGTLKSVQMAKISHCQVDWNGSQWLILICHLLLIKFAENENAVADVWKCQFFSIATLLLHHFRDFLGNVTYAK